MTTKIKCPHCESDFDITNYLDKLRDEFMLEVENIIFKMKNEGK